MKQFEDLITLTAWQLRTTPTHGKSLCYAAHPYVFDILRGETRSPSIVVVCPLQSIKGVLPTTISHSSHYAIFPCAHPQFMTTAFGYAPQGSSGMSYCNQTPFPPCEGWGLGTRLAEVLKPCIIAESHNSTLSSTIKVLVLTSVLFQ